MARKPSPYRGHFRAFAFWSDVRRGTATSSLGLDQHFANAISGVARRRECSFPANNSLSGLVSSAAPNFPRTRTKRDTSAPQQIMAQAMGAPLSSHLPPIQNFSLVSAKKQIADALPNTKSFQWLVFVATGICARTSAPCRSRARQHFSGQSLMLVPRSRSLPYGGLT